MLQLHCTWPRTHAEFLDGANPWLQDMMAAVEASDMYEGHTKFVAEEGASKGKLVCNRTTLRALGWRPKYGVAPDLGHRQLSWLCSTVISRTIGTTMAASSAIA